MVPNGAERRTGGVSCTALGGELWAILSPCLVVIAQLVSVVASVKCVRQPHEAGWRGPPESAPWQIPRALGWGRQSFAAQAPGLQVQGWG